MGKRSAWLVRLGVVLLAAALALTLYNLRQSNDAAQTAAQVLRELETALPASQKPAKAPSAAASPQETEPKPDYVLNPDMEMPVARVQNRDYIGVLTIPELGLELPIISTWDYPSLRVSPCRYTGSVYTDNMIIAAHNYASHFGRLRELSPGDSLTFQDIDGNVFSYTVADLELIDPYDIPQMTAGDWDLTLFTCTLGGQQRVTLRCDRTDAV